MKINTAKIIEYAKQNVVFTTRDIFIHFPLTQTDENALNIVLHRLCKNNELYRYEPGIYGYMQYNMFAQKRIMPSEQELIDKIYLRSGEGYITDGYYLNRIGISTWCPAKRTIVSNRVRRTTEKYNTIIKKPHTTITKTNEEYLQLLDGIEAIFNRPIDCNDPYKIFYHLIKSKDLAYLIYLAQNYYSKKVGQYIFKTIGSEYHETT